VTKNISRLETLLKVIITPIVSTLNITSLGCSSDFGAKDPPDAFVLNYILLIGDSSFSNFQKVRCPWMRVMWLNLT
jgi:hypothetical protein